ncbi:hypothetical protein U9M48_043872, partial [Paspalum notatum var. saurae]
MHEKHKRRCLNIDITHQYLYSSQGMVTFTTEHIQYLKETYNERSYLGLPIYNCKYCNAVFWFAERNKTESKRCKQIVYSNCCKHEEIKIPPLKQPPQFLSMLLKNKENSLSKHFMQKIRQYNSLFAFTSMGGNINKNINKGDGPYVFRINGQIHHRIGSLLPQPNKIQNDTEGDDLDPYLIEELKRILDTYNPLVKVFRHARDLFERYKGIDISIHIIGANKGDPIQYEMPHTEELAMLIVGEPSLENFRRDIIRGFQLGIPYHKRERTTTTKKKRKEIQSQYMNSTSSMLDEPNPLLCYGRLSKQAAIDAHRLMYVARNQHKLRAEYLQGIFDAIEKGLSEGNQIGKRVLLPSSHTGSRRYIVQNYHDGITKCRVYGPPDLFITFTCNPKWQEIIYMGVTSCSYIDLVRKNENEITPEMIDRWISAEIPHPREDPLAYILISEHTMHGPCGDKNENCPCMKKG